MHHCFLKDENNKLLHDDTDGNCMLNKLPYKDKVQNLTFKAQGGRPTSKEYIFYADDGSNGAWRHDKYL